jgi:spore germination protein KB
VLYDGIGPVLKGAADLFSFPYGEVVIFLMVFYCLKSKKSSYKVYTSALAVSGFLGTMVTMSVVLILGAEYASTTYYPSYMAEMRMNIAGFLERLEIIVSIGFLAAGFVKISICLLAACNGLSKVLGFKNYRFLVIPVALLMLNLAYLIYPNIMESYKWVTKVWIYYAFPFQVVLPLIIWIGCEIKARISRKAS